MDHFELTVDASGGTVLVRPSGELDVASAPELWQALSGLLGHDHPSVVMDLSRLTFSDCAGLKPIRRAVRQGALVGTEVELRDALPAVRRVLELTGLGSPTAV